MKYFIIIKKIIVSGIISLFLCHNAIANLEWRYNHDEDNYASNKDWMKKLHSLRKINRLSIPGTHNSASMYGGDSVQTQSLTLEKQLDAGIRFLDLRLMQKGSTLHFYHGSISQDQTFNEALDVIIQFLKDNPSEMVIIRIKEENKPEKPTETFADLIYGHVKQNIDFFHKTTQSLSALTLGDVRGKIVILQDFSNPVESRPFHPINDHTYFYKYAIYDPIKITDDWYLSSNWALYDKWKKIKKVIAHANATQDSFDDTYMENTYLTYLTGNGGSFPYFVVSGKSSHGNDDPQLLTGLTTPGWKDTWPDFPRVGCWGSLCSIAFLGTNMLVDNYIREHKPTFAGWLATDFPGPKLIKTIINLNSNPITHYNMVGSDEIKRVSDVTNFIKIMDLADTVQIKITNRVKTPHLKLMLPRAYHVKGKNKRVVVEDVRTLGDFKVTVYFPNKAVDLDYRKSVGYTYKWTDSYNLNQQYELEKLKITHPSYLKSFFHTYPFINRVIVTTSNGNWVNFIHIPLKFMKSREITVKVESDWDVQVKQGKREITLSKGQSHTFYPQTTDETNTESSDTYTIDTQHEINNLGNPDYISGLFEIYNHIKIITSNGSWRENIILPTTYNGNKKVTITVHSDWSVRVEKGNERRELKKGQKHVYTYTTLEIKPKTYACHHLMTFAGKQRWIMILGFNEATCKAKNQCFTHGRCYLWKEVKMTLI